MANATTAPEARSRHLRRGDAIEDEGGSAEAGTQARSPSSSTGNAIALWIPAARAADAR
jgi:hypothetical protein